MQFCTRSCGFRKGEEGVGWGHLAGAGLEKILLERIRLRQLAALHNSLMCLVINGKKGHSCFVNVH